MRKKYLFLIICSIFLFGCKPLFKADRVIVDGYSFSKEEYKIGTITNNSNKKISIKVFSYELGCVEESYDVVYEIEANPSEVVDLKYFSTYGFTSGDTFEIEINDWKGAGWFCKDYEKECAHSIDGIWCRQGYSYSTFVRDEETGELLPFILNEIQITVTEDDKVDIKVIPYILED